jgi:hypothetical protein
MTAAPRTTPLPTLLARAAVFLAASLACVLAGYLAINVPGAWFPSAAPQRFDAVQMGVSRGRAQATPGALLVSTANAEEPAVVVLKASLRSSDFAGIEWIVAGLPDDADVRLMWRTNYQPERLNIAPMKIDGGRLRPIVVRAEPAWIGTIVDLGLAVRGNPHVPFEVRGVIARPLGAVELVRDRFGEWLAFEGWRATSVDTLAGGADAQDLPLPVVLVLATLLAVGAYVLVRRFRPSLAPTPWPIFAVAVLALAWGLADLRYGWNAVHQSLATARSYGGKDWLEAHLAAEDAVLFKLVQSARAGMPDARSRVFVLAEAPYFRARAAYYFYPHNPWFDVYGNAGPSPQLMRPGDYVFAFRRRGVQFSPKLERLRIDGGTEMPAEPVLVAADGALFRLK